MSAEAIGGVLAALAVLAVMALDRHPRPWPHNRKPPLRLDGSEIARAAAAAQRLRAEIAERLREGAP